MALGPCLNPNCKSHGQPHPNCRCYMAAGGEAKPCECHLYATENQSRLDTNAAQLQLGGKGKVIELADGGFVPDSAFVADAAPASAGPESNSPNTQDFVSDAQFKPDAAPAAAKGGGNEFVSDSDFKPDGAYNADKPDADYATKALTVAEGAGQGLLGPVATAAELGLSKLGVPGLSAQEQRQRAESSPALHYGAEATSLAASMLYGVGEASLLGKGAQAVSEALPLGKIGASVVKHALESGLIQGGDEVTNYLLGKQVDPTAVAAAGIVGGALGPVLGLVAKGGSDAKLALEAISDGKIQSKVDSFMHGFGAAAAGQEIKDTLKAAGEKIPLDSIRRGASVLPPPAMDNAMIKAGHGAYGTWQKKLPEWLSEPVVGGVAHATGSGPLGYLALRQTLGKPIESFVTKANEKFIAPALVKAMASGNTEHVVGALKYARSIGKGAAAMTSAVDSLFKAGLAPTIDAVVDDRDRDKLTESLENGGIDAQLQTQKQMYAEGGEVEKPAPPVLAGTQGITAHYPEQAMMLGNAKGRVSQYLNSLRPAKNLPKAAFDDDHDMAGPERQYKRVADMALSPLAILNRVKDGSVTGDEVAHYKALYPELHDALSKKMTERMMQSQLDEERPHYRTRQGMSTFLGSPVDSCMTQPNVAAAQMAFRQQKAQMPQPAPAKNKKGTATLTKASEQYQTPNQAAQMRSRQ